MDTDGRQPPQKRDESEKPKFDDPGRIGNLKEQMYSRDVQPKKRPRRPLTSLDRNTPQEWQEPTPPPKKEPMLPRSHSLPSIVLIISILVFVIAGGVAISFFISGTNVVTSSKIDISINGPRTIDGGEVLELQVAVRNNNSATLDLADLVVTYPPGTRVPTNLALSMEDQRIPLGSIEPGGTRNGTIRGVLFGRNGEYQDIQVALEYRLRGSNAVFFAEAKHTILVSSGTLDISLNAKDTIVAGQNVDMTATITSNAKTTVSDVVLRATYPFGFEVISTSPETQSNGFWSLGNMEPGEARVVRIVGTLDGQTGDSRVFKFSTGTRKNARSTLVDVVLADFEKEVTVTRPFLGMSLSYAKLSSEDYVARIGKSVPIELSWKNNLDVSLSDVVVAATVSGSAFDPFNISANLGFYRSIDSVVLWDKTTTKGALSIIPGGQDGTLSMQLTPSLPNDALFVIDPTIKIELHAAGQQLSAGSVPETIQATVSEEIKVATNAGFSGRALYFENPLGSVGPLPPKIENETTYGILWELSNTTSLVRDVKVTAILPPYVRWLGTVSPSVENVTFNENDGTVTWYVGKLLPETGVRGKLPRRVVFSIGLVPSTSQVGKSPDLILNQKLVGIDNFVEVPVNITLNNLTTILDEADFANVYGTVVR